MAIRSYRGEARLPSELAYPILMETKTSGIVVLFTDKTTGTVVSIEHKSPYKLGEHVINFIEATDSITWEVFKGTITLSNP